MKSLIEIQLYRKFNEINKYVFVFSEIKNFDNIPDEKSFSSLVDPLFILMKRPTPFPTFYTTNIRHMCTYTDTHTRVYIQIPVSSRAKYRSRKR